MSIDKAADASLAIASGAASVAVAILGVHPQLLMWVAVGAGFGMLATPSESRGRAIATFALTAMAGALLATVVADRWMGGDEQARNLVGLGSGLTFPAIRERAMAAAPIVLDAILKRIGLGAVDR